MCVECLRLVKDNIIQVIKRYIGLISVSEMKWFGTEECEIDKHKMIFEENDIRHMNAVGLNIGPTI